MESGDRSRALIIEHYERYPKMRIADLFKYLFQSTFGCEHLVLSEESAIENIKREYANIKKLQTVLTDRLDGEYSRVHFFSLESGLMPETLGKIFCLSAKAERDGKENIKDKLQVARELIANGDLPFDLAEFDAELVKWEEQGYSALHHSEVFRYAYSPAYRVVANEYVKFLPLFTEIDKKLSKGSVTVAIEGGSASGKTTLGKMIERIYDCNVFHMDDFFLRPEQRTKERYAEVGGNVDRERFLYEVLLPTSKREDVNYRRFDCGTQTIEEPVSIESKRLTIVEGAYSMHPELAPYYDISVFLDISAEHQMERILKRNSPEIAERFFKEWIPLEKLYFDKTDIKRRCTLVINTEND